MRVLTPPASSNERMVFFVFLAVAVHGLMLFGTVWSQPQARAADDFKVVWVAGIEAAGDFAGSAASMSGGALESETAGGVVEEPTLLTLEQEYVRQWVQRTERVGAHLAKGLKGEVVAHVTVGAEGAVRHVAVESGPTALSSVVQRIVTHPQLRTPFPPALRALREELQISRRWLFGATGTVQVQERS